MVCVGLVLSDLRSGSRMGVAAKSGVHRRRRSITSRINVTHDRREYVRNRLFYTFAADLTANRQTSIILSVIEFEDKRE